MDFDKLWNQVKAVSIPTAVEAAADLARANDLRRLGNGIVTVPVETLHLGIAGALDVPRESVELSLHEGGFAAAVRKDGVTARLRTSGASHTASGTFGRLEMNINESRIEVEAGWLVRKLVALWLLLLRLFGRDPLLRRLAELPGVEIRGKRLVLDIDRLPGVPAACEWIAQIATARFIDLSEGRVRLRLCPTDTPRTLTPSGLSLEQAKTIGLLGAELLWHIASRPR